MKKGNLRLVLPALFIVSVVAANIGTSHLGLVPVGFGLTATAGTYCAGATFILRDLIHDRHGRAPVIALILAGAVVSTVGGAGRIAVASGIAFLLSEVADLAVYAPLRHHGYVRAAVASNVAGAFVDTLLFLAIAGFSMTSWTGQMIGKLWLTAVPVAGVVIVRAVLRHPQQSSHP